jgi:hypothetical protein
LRIEFTIIDDHGRRYSGAANLEAPSVDAPPHDARAAVRRQEGPNSRNSLAKRLPDHIPHLREGGFFREPRASWEVHEKLQETYSCLPDRVQMALLRMQRRRELRKAIKRAGDQEKTAYVW